MLFPRFEPEAEAFGEFTSATTTTNNNNNDNNNNDE